MKRIKETMLIGILMIVLTGCAGVRFREALDTWRGHTINELIETAGPPTSTFKMPNGTTIYTYEQRYQPVSVASRNISGDVDIYTQQYWCKTSFFVDSNHMITQWKIKGTYCVSL